MTKKPDLARYRTTDWSEYNAALKSRGSLMVWLDKEHAVGRFSEWQTRTRPDLF